MGQGVKMKAIRFVMWSGQGQSRLEHPIFNLNVVKRNWQTSEFDEADLITFKNKVSKFQQRSREISEMPEFVLVNRLIKEHMTQFGNYVKGQMESHRWKGAK